MKTFRLATLVLLICGHVLWGREQVNISFSKLAIDDFIGLVAKISGKNILVHQRINGDVNLITTAPVYDDEVMGILISVLEAKGYTLIQNGSVYEVLLSADAASSNAPVVAPGRHVRGDTMATQAIRVNGENVDVIASKIRYLISKNAKLMTIKESNTMLVTDYPANIETVKAVIAHIDRDASQVLKIVEVAHADVKQLHKQLSDIAANLFNSRVETETVKILLNTDINALIFIGPESNIAKLETIVSELDREQNYDEVVQIINLKNSDADNVLASLNDIVSKQTYADASLKPNISANKEINAIIMIGSPGVIKSLKHVITELDKEKYQVYVQARIVEINNNDSEKIGLKYGLEGGIANSSSLYTFASNFGGSAFTLSSTVSDIFKADLVSALGTVDQALALGAALDFLQTNNASKTVSNPSILCVNNQESSIYVGKTISIQTGETTGSAGTTASYQREDVGLTLKIKPRVSSGEKVTLDIETILENVIGNENSTQPVTTKQNVVTQSILRHGESIIIGGLVKTYETDTETKLPLLGDIPLLGMFFTHHATEEQQDNLLVILTPYVIDKSEKLSELQHQLGELGRLQKAYNKVVFAAVEKQAE